MDKSKDKMKAITLWQPWASLIACGVKTVETRSWPPPGSLIGQRIAIHAAKKWNKELLDICFRPEFQEVLSPMRPNKGGAFYYEDALKSILPLGVVVCTAVLTDAWMVNRHERSTGVVRAESHEIMEDVAKVCRLDPWGDFTPGRWLWFFDEVEVLDPPIPARGRQQIWSWSR